MSENDITTQEEADAYRNEVENSIWGDGKLPVETLPEPAQTEDVDEIVEELDPLAGLDPAVKEMFDDMKGKLDGLDDLTYRLKQAENRVGSMQNFLSNPKAPVVPAAEPVKDESWDELKEEYPEWEEVLQGIDKKIIPVDVDSIRSELATDFEGKLSDVQRGFEIKLISMKHPGWETTVAKPEYTEWLGKQPLELQDTARNSNRSEDAINVLNKYAEFTASQKPKDDTRDKKNERLARSQSFQGKPPIRQKAVEDMTDAEYRAYLAEK